MLRFFGYLTVWHIYISIDFSSYSFYQLYNDYGIISAETYEAVAADENVYGLVEVTEANKAAVLKLMDEYCSAFGISIYDEEENVIQDYYMEFLFYQSGVGEEVSFDAVDFTKLMTIQSDMSARPILILTTS